MKIYLSITPFFPNSKSFQGPFILDQIKALERNSNYKVLVFKPKRWFSKEMDYTYEGIRIYRFRSFELPSNLFPGLFSFLSVWSFKRKLKKLNISVHDIKIVHAHVTGLGIFANALKKVNKSLVSILQHHGFDVLSLENGILNRFKLHLWLVKCQGIKVCNQIDLHVGVSQKTLEYLKSFKKIKIKDSYVLYNGVDPGKFYSIPGLKSQAQFVIGCIGNFWLLKDQITLLKSAKILVEMGMDTLLIKLVGTGVTLDSCKKYVTENQMEGFVEFIPSIPHNDLVKFYNSLNLFVLPSYYEAFGCVYTEAHACGVPFIGVQGQGISELITENEKSIWLIEKGDYLGLSQKIKTFEKTEPKQSLTLDYDIDLISCNFLNYLNRQHEV